MQLIRIEAKQCPDYAHEKSYAGACINCYIKDQTAENALYIARGWIAKNGWDVVAIEEQREISEEDCEDSSDGKKFFQQTVIDEEVFVYYCFETEDNRHTLPNDATKNI